MKLKAAEKDLMTLLKEFGPPRQSHHPEYPFWRLQNDGVWVVHADGKLKPRAGNTNPLKSELIAHDARGGFADDVKAALRAVRRWSTGLRRDYSRAISPSPFIQTFWRQLGCRRTFPGSGRETRDFGSGY